jgi:hypothetical protein
MEPKDYEFAPVSVESYGCLSQPAMKLLHMLGEEAAGAGGDFPGFICRGCAVGALVW